MATVLAPVDSRAVVRCDHCHLTQFRTTNNLCRKCRASLDDDEKELRPAAGAATMAHEHVPVRVVSLTAAGVATAIRQCRNRADLSQRKLAAMMGVPRTYISKVENDNALPTLKSLERFAAALHVAIPELFAPSEGNIQEQRIEELMKDPFLLEIIDAGFHELRPEQQKDVFLHVKALSVKPQ